MRISAVAWTVPALAASIALTACPEPREDDPAVEAPVPAPAIPEEDPWLDPDSPAMEPVFEPAPEDEEGERDR